MGCPMPDHELKCQSSCRVTLPLQGLSRSLKTRSSLPSSIWDELDWIPSSADLPPQVLGADLDGIQAHLQHSLLRSSVQDATPVCHSSVQPKPVSTGTAVKATACTETVGESNFLAWQQSDALNMIQHKTHYANRTR